MFQRIPELVDNFVTGLDKGESGSCRNDPAAMGPDLFRRIGDRRGLTAVEGKAWHNGNLLRKSGSFK